MEKQDARLLSTDALSVVHKRALALFKQGYTRAYIAEILGVHRNSVCTWVKAYQAHGAKSLIPDKPGRKPGSCRHLTPDQERAIQRMIRDKTPDQLKLPFALWTRRAILKLIEEQIGLVMPIRTVGEYLKRWGYTPQRPYKRAYEQNDKKVQAWLTAEYPEIERRARSENAEIHWGDETGVRHDSNYGRSYAPKGKTPVIRRTAKRFSTSMISTVNKRGKVRFMCFPGAMNSQIFIRFLKRLTKDCPRKVFLIVDNLRVHHSRIVTKWVEANKDQIELFFLPPYTPERNPDEYLNRDLKQTVANQPPAKNENQLKRQVVSQMRKIQKLPARIRTYFKNSHVQYAA